MRWLLFAIVLASLAAKSPDPKLDVRRLQTGRFLYRTMVNGKDAGTSDISIRKLSRSGYFSFTNNVAGQFTQHWEAIATSAFAPISAKLTFGDGDDRRPAFDLRYLGGRVTGSAKEAAGEADVDAQVVPDTIDQRIDWAAALSQDLVPGREFSFHVFDPGTGNSRVIGRVGSPETLRVPAGTFPAMRIVYRIEKAGGVEVYQVFTRRTGLRMLLKEVFPNGAVTELMEVRD